MTLSATVPYVPYIVKHEKLRRQISTKDLILVSQHVLIVRFFWQQNLNRLSHDRILDPCYV
jgi:hypothetical protein